MHLEGKLKEYEHFFIEGRNTKGNITVQFLGTNCLYFDDGKTKIMVDPHFTRPNVIGPEYFFKPIKPDKTLILSCLKKAGIDSLNALLIGHSHYDHAMDSAETSIITDAKIYGSITSKMIALGGNVKDEKIYRIDQQNKIKVGDFNINFIKTIHMPFPWPLSYFIKLGKERFTPLIPPSVANEYLDGGTYNIHIKNREDSILIVGSPNYIKGSLDNVSADTVFLAAGGLGYQNNKFQSEYFKETAKAVNAKKIIMTHWDDFAKPLYSPVSFCPKGDKAVDSIIKNAHKTNCLVYLPKFHEKFKI